MKYRKFLLRLGAVLVLLGMSLPFIPVVPAGASGQYVYIRPAHGPMGTRIYVEGASFTPSVISENDSVDDVITFARIYFPDKNTLVKTTAIDYMGDFSTYFTVGEYPAGDYKVWVYDQSASPPVWTGVTFTMEPELSLDRPSGYAGDNISITGTGFTASANATIYFDDSVAAYATANASGTFNVTSLTVPEGASMSHTIKAIDSENNTAESSFFSKHRITVTPSSGTVGSEVVISGTGFSIGREIAVRFNYEAIETKPVSIMTDSNGSFTGKIHIPYRAVNPYTVEASDGTLKDDAVLNITFGGKFSRVVGCIDSGVTFNGAGFIPGRVAVVSFDGVPVNESTVDNLGRLACSFEVPVASAGEHTVTITDGTNSLESTFTVVFSASVETNRDTGYVGSDIIFSGTGFIPGRVAVISYDSIPVAESDIDSSGDFSTFFSIPASIAGEHIISATDGFNKVNSTFTMESLAPSSPVLLMPEEDGETEPEVCFVWEEVADRSGVTYNLQVFADAGFQSGNISGMVLEKFDLPGPRYVLSGEEVLKRKSTPYYWRVRAVDGAFNTGEFSEVQAFCVSPAREPWFYCSLVVEGGIFGGLLAIWVVRKRRNSASQAGGEPVTEDI